MTRTGGRSPVEAVALAGRFALAWLFLLAGVTKLADIAAFEKAVGGYRLLPDRLVRPVARLLPPTEVAAGALMGAGVTISVVGIGLTLLLIGFAAAVTINLLRGRSIDCGCFGPPGSERISWGLVARDVLLAALAAAVAVTAPEELSIPVFGPPAAAPVLSASDALAVLLTTTGVLVAVPLVVNGLRIHRRLSSGGAR
jgi:uncharacterized membrane protein YphA (DoxX/SURF4 family)